MKANWRQNDACFRKIFHSKRVRLHSKLFCACCQVQSRETVCQFAICVNAINFHLPAQSRSSKGVGLISPDSALNRLRAHSALSAASETSVWRFSRGCVGAIAIITKQQHRWASNKSLVKPGTSTNQSVIMKVARCSDLVWKTFRWNLIAFVNKNQINKELC